MILKSYYSYHPDLALRLGRSFDPTNPDAMCNECVEYDSEVSDPGSALTTVEATFVQTEEHLLRTVGYDISVQAKTLVFDATATYKYTENTQRDKVGLSLVLSAHADFGRTFMKGARLCTDAKATVGTPKTFTERYGTHYVACERRGAALSVVLDLDGMSETTKRKVAGSLDATGGFGPLSATVKAKFDDELQATFARNEVSIRIFAIGGAGFSEMGELVRTALASGKTGVDPLLLALRDVLKHYSPSTGHSLGYYIAPLGHFGGASPTFDPFAQEKEAKILEIARNYQSAQRRRSLVRRLQNEEDVRGFAVPMSQASLAEIEREYAKLAQALRVAYTSLLEPATPDVDSPSLEETDQRLLAVLRPVVSLRVDDLATGERLSPSESAKKIREKKEDAGAYVLIEAVDIVEVRVLYRDSSRHEESGLVVETTSFNTDSKKVDVRGYALGCQVALWNQKVTEQRRSGLGTASRERGSGTFYVQVVDSFGNVTERDVARCDWSREKVSNVEFSLDEAVVATRGMRNLFSQSRIA